jgi:hypothetical protein
MTRTRKPLKYSILILALLLAVTLLFPTSALAAEITFDDTVEKGEVVDQNLVLAGPVVVMDGVIHGDLLAVGDEVKINGEVDGNLVVIGKQVLLNGPVSGSVYLSALTLVVGPQASVGRDVSFIGGRLETQAASSIKRDLNLISLEAVLSGSTGRQVKALVGPLKLFQSLVDLLKSQGWLPQARQPGFHFPRVAMTDQAALGMAFASPSLQNLLRWSSAPTDVQPLQQAAAIDTARLKAWLVPFLRNLASLLILGLLGLWLLPRQLTLARQQAQTHPWRSLLNGLLIFVLGWFSALLLFILVLALAFFLYWISLPTLGFLAGFLGLTGLGLAVVVFWLSIAYFSKIIIAILFGALLINRILPKYAHNRILPLLVGVILYALLASIPYLGWLVAVVATFFGLGALWMGFSQRSLPEGQSAPQSQPAGDNLDVSFASEG